MKAKSIMDITIFRVEVKHVSMMTNGIGVLRKCFLLKYEVFTLKNRVLNTLNFDSYIKYIKFFDSHVINKLWYRIRSKNKKEKNIVVQQLFSWGFYKKITKGIILHIYKK